MVSSLSSGAKLYLLSSVLGSFAGSINGLYFNLYLKALGYGQDLIGVLSAIPAFVVTVLALAVGLAAGRVGYKKLILSGMLLQAVAWIIPALFPLRSWLLAAAFLGGLGGTLGGVVGGPLLSELAEGRARERLFGFQSGLAVLAGMTGSALGGLLPAFFSAKFSLQLGSPEVYKLVIILSFAIFLVSVIPVIAIPNRGPKNSVTFRHLRPHRHFIFALAGINGLIGIGAGLLLPFVNLFFKLRFSVPDSTLGLIFALNSLLIGVGNILSPFLARRMGRIRLVVLCQALSLPFFFLWGYVPLLSLSALGYLLRTSLMNLAGPMFSVEVLERVLPELRGGVNAISMVFWNGGWALGSLVSGFIQVRYGFSPLFPVTVFLYSLAIYWTRKALEKPPEVNPEARSGDRFVGR
jgi:MFS family permease